MSVTAVVVHWSSLGALPRCLDALGHPAGLEVVVVDNASPDGGEKEIRKTHPHVRWLAMGRNAGFGAAVNAGAAATRSDWILALNPDTTISGEDAVAMAEAARSLGAAALGPKIVGRDGRIELSYRRADSLGGDLGWMLAWRTGRSGKATAAPREVAWVTGACLLVRREDFERAGGFDEGYFLYFEDADLCRRIRTAGGKVIYHPGFSATHLRRGSARDGAGPLELAYRKSQIRYASRHRSRLGQKIVRWSLVLRSWLMLGPWSPSEVRGRGAALRDLLRPAGLSR